AKESLRKEVERYKASQSDRWEYITVEDISGTRLGDLGVSGWELAGVVPYGASKALIIPYEYIHAKYIFKRKIVVVPPEVMSQISGKYKVELMEGQIADLEEMREQIS